MKLKKLIACVLACMMLAGCTQNTPFSSGSSSAESAEVNIAEEYELLAEDNSFYAGEKENIERFIRHGTGILVLGFPACPWCQAYLPMLDEVLKDNDMTAMYYNIRVDKTEDRPFYDLISDVIEEVNDTGEQIIQYNNDGLQTIYMPLVLFIDNGRITYFNNETSMENSDEITPEEYWSEEKVDALKQQLAVHVKEISEARKANDDKGCDTGCEVKPSGSGS